MSDSTRPVRIVVLDGFNVNPGDLDWAPLRALGYVDIHDRTPVDRVTERARDAEILVANKLRLDATQLDALPKLRMVAVTATGFDTIDVQATQARHIVVANVPDYSTAAVAEHTFALICALNRRAEHHAQRVREGAWIECPDFAFWETPQIELAGQTMGIVGWGKIGRRVGAIANACGMEVVAVTRSEPNPEDRLSCVTFVSRRELLQRADVVSLHCPLTDATHLWIDADALRQMKRDAVLINTARGGLIDEAALAEALGEKRIRGAALDTLSQEPMRDGCRLRELDNCLITPHLAWATRASRQRLLLAVAENVKAFLSGHPRNVV